MSLPKEERVAPSFLIRFLLNDMQRRTGFREPGVEGKIYRVYEKQDVPMRTLRQNTAKPLSLFA